jgi:hypothetical protein
VLGEPVLGADDLGDRRLDELCVAERGERDPPDPVSVLLDELGRGLQSKPRLAGAAGAGQGDEPGGGEQLEQLGQLRLAADERGRCTGRFVWLSVFRGGNWPSPSW